MIITVYHAGPVCIETFHIPRGGLHLGGFNSALAAGLRKIRGGEYFGSTLHMHEVQLNIGAALEVVDCGSNELWQGVIEFVTGSTQYDALRYTNTFELDDVQSWVVFNTSIIHRITDRYIITEKDAQEMLDEYLEKEVQR